MNRHVRSRLAIPQPLEFIAEVGLLNLFAPAFSHAETSLPISRTEHILLWRADAIHRAKNLAQMSIALANLAGSPGNNLIPACAARRARSLVRAYEALGDDIEFTRPVPCAALLTEVVHGLVDIFGGARSITAHVSADAVFLVPAERRALVLIASELTINALKYGFSGVNGGTISVYLTGPADGINLIVQNDGEGCGTHHTPGLGSELIDNMAAILNARVTRSAGHNGQGFCVRVSN